VKIENFNNKSKWAFAYLMTPQGMAEKKSLSGGHF
jgi:hypothetical protein